ncbi:MAG: penicillin acylase family protein [Acidobacteriota bacterium]
MASPDASLSGRELHTRGSARRLPARRWTRVLLGTFGAILILVLLLATGFVLWLRAATKDALPQLDGTIRVPGLSAPVTVRRDTHGVPHIAAATQDDLFFAQGYVTAQDRLWQMDMYRRNADGDLAEVLGAALVKHDVAQRVLGFRNQAQRIYANLDPDDRRRIDDYARGVNAFIAQHQHDLPEEFRLLMYKPQPWTGADSMSMGMMMIDTLDTHWDVKYVRGIITAKLNNAQMEAELYPVGSWRDHPPTGEVSGMAQPQPASLPQEDGEDRAGLQGSGVTGQGSASRAETSADARAVDVRDLRATLGLPVCDNCASGSNNWVVSGAHTASGKPLLANDMHLQLSEPNIWYMADLRAPGFHSDGVTLPGMPMVIAGHNEHVAWGFTALYADVQDLYFETLDGHGHYKAVDGTWKPLAVDRETFHVRGGHDVTINVESTDHGPIVTPIIPGETRPIALRWTLYDPSLHSVPLFAMNTATNWKEFSAAIEEWAWPTQNLVYADDQGHIAYHAVGRVPLRPAGLVGLPIADTQHEWQGYIPFSAMPNEFDPPSGFLATANSRVTTPRSPYQLSLEWIDPYRAERIYKLLDGRNGLTPSDMLATQTDIYSDVDQELGHRFAYAIDHTPNADARLRQAADLLLAWDGRLTKDSAAASIVDQARYALWPLILTPKLGAKLAEEYRFGEKNYAEEEIIMHGSAEWLPPGYKDWDAVLTEAVRRGMESQHAPADVSRWTYGSWHRVDIEHPLASMLPLIARFAGTGPQPMSGDTTTVKQVSLTVAPSQRFTMDWSNVDGSTENIVMGESSDPYSRYYRDQWNDWYYGTTFAMPFTPAAVSAATRHTLRLIP